MGNNKEIRELNIKENIIGKISNFFSKRRQITALVIIMIIILGVNGIYTLPKESLPEIAFPTLIIQTAYPGASPQDVESLVTDKIEDKVSNLEDVNEITSDSNFGFSSVNVSFNDGVDIDRKKLEVDSLINEINFSQGVLDPDVAAFNTSEIPLMEISVAGNYSIFELTNISEDIKSEIEKISGVEEVKLKGVLDREIHIVVKKPLMQEYGINMSTVQNALRSLNISLPIGELNMNGSRYNLRVDEELESLEEIRKTSITTQKGSTIFIEDIAEVLDTSEEVVEYNNTYVKDEDRTFKSVKAEIIRKADSDVIGTSAEVKEMLENMKGDVYPEDIKVNISSDLAVNVRNDLAKVQESALSGLIVVILVLFLFIGFKESLIVAIAIPLSLFMTLASLGLFDITLNTFAVLGIIVSLGLIVDNSIIAIENIDRLKNKGLSRKEAARVGINQVGFPILAATLTTVAAFFPLSILPGILGEFVNTIPRTIIITLVSSFIISIIITPTLYIIIKKKRIKKDIKLNSFVFSIIKIILVGALSFYAFSNDGDNLQVGIVAVIFFASILIYKEFFFSKQKEPGNFLIKNYKKLITFILRKSFRKAFVFILGIIILIGSVGLIFSGMVKIAFFPTNEPNTVNITIDTPGGYTLDQTSEISAQVEDYLMGIEEIESFNTTVGGREIDKALISATFTDKETREINGIKLVEKIERDLRLIPGGEIIVEGQSSGGPPVGKPISLRLVGDSLDNISKVSKDYSETLKSIEGVYNVELSAKDGAPQIYIDIKENKAQTMGISVLNASQQLREIVEGIEATTIKDGRDEINVILKCSSTPRYDINSLDTMCLTNISGDNIPLGSIAEIKEISGISGIKHIDGDRLVIIDADLREGYNANEITEIFQEKISDYNMPSGVELQLGGDVEGIQENFSNLFRSMILAVFLVFIILTLQFGSVAQPFAILTTVPMALIGVLWGLALTGNDFGFYSFMALIALVGIAVNDAIVLIDYMNYLRSEGMNLFEAIVEAGETRFNPVIATSLTTIGGVLPLAFKEVYYAQFGFSLVFGLMITSILTLFFIPIMYSFIEGLKLKKGSLENE